jgi:hypothetical protein
MTATRTIALTAAATLFAVATTSCFRLRNKDTADTGNPDQEVEDATRAISEAMQINFFATELGQAATSDEASDTSSSMLAMMLDEDDCPYVTLGDGTITVDYGEGCIPDSGILFGEISGSMSATVDREARSVSGTYEELSYMGYGIDGTMGLQFTREPGVGIDLVQQMDLTFTDSNISLSLYEDVMLTLRYTYLLLDGEIDYDAGWDSFDIEANDVKWDYDNLTLTCPLPSSGSMQVQWAASDVTFTFDEDSPQTGMVEVEGVRNAGDFNICAWWYGI